MIKNKVDVTALLEMLNKGSNTKGRQQIYGPQGLARFDAWNSKQLREKEKAGQQEVKQEQPEIKKQETPKTPGEIYKEKLERQKQEEAEIAKIRENIEKEESIQKGYADLNKIKDSKRYGNRAKQLAIKLKKAQRDGEDTAGVLNEIKELIEEIRVMKNNFQLGEE
jgi:hypothetical protein